MASFGCSLTSGAMLAEGVPRFRPARNYFSDAGDRFGAWMVARVLRFKWANNKLSKRRRLRQRPLRPAKSGGSHSGEILACCHECLNVCVVPLCPSVSHLCNAFSGSVVLGLARARSRWKCMSLILNYSCQSAYNNACESRRKLTNGNVPNRNKRAASYT